MKAKTQQYIDDHKMTEGALADAAGVGRWSLSKWLRNPEAEIFLKTWEKLQRFMTENP